MKTVNDKELKAGKVFQFSNEHLEQDDIKTAEVSYSENLKKFIIIFNGKLIYSSLTGSAMRHRLHRLCFDWNLKEVTE